MATTSKKRKAQLNAQAVLARLEQKPDVVAAAPQAAIAPHARGPPAHQTPPARGHLMLQPPFSHQTSHRKQGHHLQTLNTQVVNSLLCPMGSGNARIQPGSKPKELFHSPLAITSVNPHLTCTQTLTNSTFHPQSVQSHCPAPRRPAPPRCSHQSLPQVLTEQQVRMPCYVQQSQHALQGRVTSTPM